MHFDRRSIPAELGDIAQWPRADESALSEQARSQLGRRVQAMSLFVDGHTPLREIARQTGVGFNDLYRMTLHLLGRACVDSFLSFLAEADQLRGGPNGCFGCRSPCMIFRGARSLHTVAIGAASRFAFAYRLWTLPIPTAGCSAITAAKATGSCTWNVCAATLLPLLRRLSA
ncbi:hypothetical protein WM16_13445 [Burkholderia ubonensis]|uniref:Uncharacterized protein n=2 Tax=Burkholderia ubonensis TaxID=101571 RepID=A0A108CJD9_9BURK|nr:hypothetical protein WM16_13445 [Burkholderia ubonensis]